MTEASQKTITTAAHNWRAWNPKRKPADPSEVATRYCRTDADRQHARELVALLADRRDILVTDRPLRINPSRRIVVFYIRTDAGHIHRVEVAGVPSTAIDALLTIGETR